jgi:hypothetical protein
MPQQVPARPRPENCPWAVLAPEGKLAEQTRISSETMGSHRQEITERGVAGEVSSGLPPQAWYHGQEHSEYPPSRRRPLYREMPRDSVP